ncbi:hypothetical protein JYU10_00240 [bacterium AH-315-J04]|nr:hypothetical protein [bacterium AH-315-J04]
MLSEYKLPVFSLISMQVILGACFCGQAVADVPAPPQLQLQALPRHQLFSSKSISEGITVARRDTNAWLSVRAAKKPFVVKDFPLQHEQIDLLLEPFSVVDANTIFVLGRKGMPDIPIDFDTSSIALFRGSVVGYENSRVYLALSENRSSGYIDLGQNIQRNFIASKDMSGRDLPTGEITVYKESDGVGYPAGVPLCGVESDVLLTPKQLAGLGLHANNLSLGTTSTLNLKQLELAVDTDYEYYFLFQDETKAVEYLIELYGAVSDIFIRDVNTRIKLVFTRIWTDPNDLYNGSNPLGQFRSHWNANESGILRDSAQLLSGRRDYAFGGQAYVSSLCNSSFGYGIVGYATGFFPDPTKPSPYGYDVQVTAHELGHSCGTSHTHNYGIDSCDLANTVPQRGSIMSYCGQTWSGMTANTDNYFHTFVRTQMNAHINSSACIVTDCNMNDIADDLDILNSTSDDVNGNNVPDECEDCNVNGVLDPADILGSSLDLNSNGIPDECELDCNGNSIPDDTDISSGFSTDAYGNGIPDLCEPDCNNNGMSDYTEIQLNMTLDVDRDAVLDACQDCDSNGQPDLVDLQNAHSLWVGSGIDNSIVREFHVATGVRTEASLNSGAALVRGGQDVIITPNRHVLISSAIDDRVMKFDEAGVYLSDLISPGAGGLDYPTGLFITDDDRLLVSSANTNSVLAYDVDTGVSLGVFITAGSGGLTSPFGITQGPDGFLYVTSDIGGASGGRILKFDATTGAFDSIFVDLFVTGFLDQPRGLTFKADGNLLVASFGTDEVLEYDWPTGDGLGKWAQVGTATAITQDSPWGIRVGPSGHVYVSRTGSLFSSLSASGDDNTPVPGDTAASHLTDARMFEYNVCTGLFRKTQIGGNDHGLEFATGFDFFDGSSVDCNFNLLTDDCDIASGYSLDLDNSGVPDECEVDCNGNGIYDRRDIIPFGSSFDVNCDFIPDECTIVPPSNANFPYTVTKDRYISFNPSTNTNANTAYRVTRMGSAISYYVSCSLEDLGADGKLGTLVASAEHCQWTDAVIHVRGCALVPGNEYIIEATDDNVAFSAPLSVFTTSVPLPRQYGDLVGDFFAQIWLDPDGIVNSTDIVAAVKRFQLDPQAPHFTRVDIDGVLPQGVVNSADILRTIKGFELQPFGFGVIGCELGQCIPNCP